MSDSDHLIGRQLAAARVLAGLSQEEVAKRADISASLLRRMEAGGEASAELKARVGAVHRALEAAGIVFIPAGEQANGGPGIRLGLAAATADDLTRKIDQLEKLLAKPIEDGPPSPARALQTMDVARNQEITKKLKARRAKLKNDPA